MGIDQDLRQVYALLRDDYRFLTHVHPDGLPNA